MSEEKRWSSLVINGIEVPVEKASVSERHLPAMVFHPPGSRDYWVRAEFSSPLPNLWCTTVRSLKKLADRHRRKKAGDHRRWMRIGQRLAERDFHPLE